MHLVSLSQHLCKKCVALEKCIGARKAYAHPSKLCQRQSIRFFNIHQIGMDHTTQRVKGASKWAAFTVNLTKFTKKKCHAFDVNYLINDHIFIIPYELTNSTLSKLSGMI